jgi:enoyl-CoA hydratase/carnithine racemase
MAIRGPEQLLIERKGHVATLTINREERANSLSYDLTHMLVRAWQDVQADSDIWAVILTAAGDRFFCCGEDLKDRAELDRTHPGGFNKYVEEHGGWPNMSPHAHGVWKPIIGAVNGAALAGGWFLSQMCDVRIAAEHATFGTPEVRWNLPAPFMAQAARMIPMGIVLETALWGARKHTAQRMYEIGWVNKVVAAGRLMEEAREWAEEVCEMGPVSVWTHKELIYRYLFHDDYLAQRFSMSIFDRCEKMADSIEGPRAFAERRKPSWKLR